MLDSEAGTKGLGEKEEAGQPASPLASARCTRPRPGPALGRGAAKTPSGLAQRNKESGCLLPRPAPLLAPGSVTAAGVKTQGGRTESQLSGPQGRGKRTLAQTSWRPQGGQSSPRDSLPRSSSPLASLRASRALLWPQGSRRGEEVGFPSVSSCPQGPCFWWPACFPEASASSWS